jgi:hypothetical protein
MTATQAKILKAAAEHCKGGFSATVSGGAGVRSVNAVRLLVAAGLMADPVGSPEMEVHRGRITRSFTISATITEAGRRAIQG